LPKKLRQRTIRKLERSQNIRLEEDDRRERKGKDMERMEER
jgi:hypothetical protein